MDDVFDALLWMVRWSDPLEKRFGSYPDNQTTLLLLDGDGRIRALVRRAA